MLLALCSKHGLRRYGIDRYRLNARLHQFDSSSMLVSVNDNNFPSVRRPPKNNVRGWEVPTMSRSMTSWGRGSTQAKSAPPCVGGEAGKCKQQQTVRGDFGRWTYTVAWATVLSIEVVSDVFGGTDSANHRIPIFFPLDAFWNCRLSIHPHFRW